MLLSYELHWYSIDKHVVVILWLMIDILVCSFFQVRSLLLLNLLECKEKILSFQCKLVKWISPKFNDLTINLQLNEVMFWWMVVCHLQTFETLSWIMQLQDLFSITIIKHFHFYFFLIFCKRWLLFHKQQNTYYLISIYLCYKSFFNHIQ